MTAIDAAPDLATIRAQVAELSKANDVTAEQIRSLAMMADTFTRAVGELRHAQANRRQVETSILDVIDRLEKLP